ncbi:MAG: hypothetical protein E3J72_09880 [Planctomycetota bacterium]|nr:MAG: hypothetical protein E3J72_09880 [Planctomycetota bacterium]
MMLRITMVNKCTAVAQIEGSLCGSFARRVADLFDSCLMRGIKALVIDMENCFSIDSLGMDLLRKLSFLELRLVNMNWSTRESCRAEMPEWSRIDGIGTMADVLKSLNTIITTQDQIILYDFRGCHSDGHNELTGIMVHA